MHIYFLWFFWVFRVIVYFWSMLVFIVRESHVQKSVLKSVSPSQVIKCCSQVRQQFFLFCLHSALLPKQMPLLVGCIDDRQPWAFSSSVPFGERISWQLLRRHHCQEFPLSASSWHWVAFSSSAFASGPACRAFLSVELGALLGSFSFANFAGLLCLYLLALVGSCGSCCWLLHLHLGLPSKKNLAFRPGFFGEPAAFATALCSSPWPVVSPWQWVSSSACLGQEGLEHCLQGCLGHQLVEPL